MSGIQGAAWGLHTDNYIWDAGTSSWIPETQYVLMSPMADIDSTIAYNADGSINSIVSTLGTATKTLTYTWADGHITAITCVLT